jgi:dephospho-CoA kinase
MTDFSNSKPQERIILIGLIGGNGSGKDTCIQDFMQQYYSDIEAVSYSMMTPLKNNLKGIFGLSDEQMNDNVLKEVVDTRYKKSPRELVEWFGTDCIRNQIDSEFWIDKFVEYYESERKNINSMLVKVIVVRDIRFQNEALALKKRGGTIIKIERNEQSGMSDSEEMFRTNTLPSSHTDELQKMNEDFLIKNNSTIKDLQKSFIDTIINVLKPSFTSVL